MRYATQNELSAGHGTDKRLSLSHTGFVSFFLFVEAIVTHYLTQYNKTANTLEPSVNL